VDLATPADTTAMTLFQPSDEASRIAGALQRGALTATVAAVLIHLAWVAGLGRPGLDFAINDLVYNAGLLAASVACLLRPEPPATPRCPRSTRARLSTSGDRSDRVERGKWQHHVEGRQSEHFCDFSLTTSYP
jgi:hypothetical protein